MMPSEIFWHRVDCIFKDWGYTIFKKKIVKLFKNKK